MTEGSKSGVKWKYATEGSVLVERSIHEAASASHDPKLSRRLYLDGVAYLLQGLPTDLNAQEYLRLRETLSFEVDPVPSGETASLDMHTIVVNERPADHKTISRKSGLRRTTATFTFWTVRAVLQAYQIDRTYRVSERTLMKTVAMAGGLRKHTLRLINRVCAIDTLSQAFQEVLVRVIQETSSGMFEGVGEGLGSRDK